MRRAARTDANHAEIIRALRASGAFVVDMSRAGGGIPDLMVLHGGRQILMEVKDGKKPPSARKLTPDQVEFHAQAQLCGVTVHVVTCVDEALAVIGAMVLA